MIMNDKHVLSSTYRLPRRYGKCTLAISEIEEKINI